MDAVPTHITAASPIVRPSMADVAAAAGVSQQTVSRVLNNHPSVRPSTRERVLTAITALGYRPNLAARALVTKRSSIIGVIAANTHLSGPSGALLGIEATARARGYWVSAAVVSDIGGAEMAQAISHFRDQGVDGLIAIVPTEESMKTVIHAIGSLPHVLVTTGEIPHGHVAVDIDQAMGVRQAMNLLIGLGHRNIAHVAGPRGHFHAIAREKAWTEAMIEAGLEPSLRVQGDWTAASGYEAAMTLLAHGEPPTAVVAANDMVALGLLRGFSEAGVAVPDQVSVVGFDDVEGTDQAIPPLTTVRQDFAALGVRCFDLLIGVLGKRTVDSELIPTRLVVRSSTAAVRH